MERLRGKGQNHYEMRAYFESFRSKEFFADPRFSYIRAITIVIVFRGVLRFRSLFFQIDTDDGPPRVSSERD